MSYNTETYSNIKSRILSSMVNTIDKREGSIINDMVSPVSIEFAKTYIELDRLIDTFFLENLEGVNLEKKADEYGLKRKTEQYAEGVVKIEGPIGTIVPYGSIVSTEDGLQYDIMIEDDYTMATNIVNLPCIAKECGRKYNIVVGAINSILPQKEGVTVTNEYIFQGGIDTETDEELLKRLREYLKNPATSGNESYYIQKCMEITGVNQVKLVPRWNGPGTLKIIATYDNQPIPNYILEELKVHIDNNRVVDANITVITPTIFYVNIETNVTLVNGATKEQVVHDLRESFNEFFNACTNKITYNKAISCLMRHEDIDDYTSFTLNGTTNNITLTDEVRPAVGKLKINGFEG